MNDNVKSAARVLDILELLARSDEPMALKDLVSVLALPKSSAHALLRTLQSRGYVERDAADRYALNEALRQSTGWIGGPEAHLAAVARPVMEQLRDELEESVFLGVREGRGDVKVIAKAVSRAADPLRFRRSRPAARPIAPGWAGVLLAFWDKKSTAAYLMRNRLRAHTPRTVTDRAKLRAILAKVAADGPRRCRRRIRARRLGDGGAGVRRQWYGRCCAERGNGVGALSGRQAADHRRRRRARQPPSASASATGARHSFRQEGIQR